MIEIIDSIGFVEDRVRQSCSWTPRRCSVTVSARRLSRSPWNLAVAVR
jgi:hypothetical protein